MKEKLSSTMLNIDNVNIYCEYICNGKPPLVLIHGFVSSTYTFNRIIPLLEKDFSVVAIDLPGFGRSEKSTSFFYSYENYARLVTKCMDYFGMDDVSIVGHSMGGQIALNTAKLMPDKVKKLFLLASSGYLKSSNRLLVYSSYLPFFSLYVKRAVNNRSVIDSLRNVFYNHSYITSDHIREFERPIKEKNFPKSLIRLLRHREGDLSPRELGKINTSTLLIWGEDDQVVPLHVGKRLVQDLPNAELITFKETGHLVTEERPNEISNLISSYYFKGQTAQ
ncbi:alpha/beta fold hydrolase [Oceanobacillus sp. Castelsardo]|uniref:alpha/beta fold hydrolase n=1 Tax=Oceanobacillus sp. Castelsardo TaxID=1851204 RepID=UPI0008386677|nr:alpha/beta hydrolase [Oceanobacillus sp. Castelsardo]